MNKEYGFFIYDEKYCCDKEGLINSLADTIINENRCIFCCKKNQNL